MKAIYDFRPKASTVNKQKVEIFLCDWLNKRNAAKKIFYPGQPFSFLQRFCKKALYQFTSVTLEKDLIL
jgi:hypothetical protein